MDKVYMFENMKIVNCLNDEKKKEYEDYIKEYEKKLERAGELTEKAGVKSSLRLIFVLAFLFFVFLTCVLLEMNDIGVFAESNLSIFVSGVFMLTCVLLPVLKEKMGKRYLERLAEKENVSLPNDTDVILFIKYSDILDVENIFQEYELSGKYRCLNRRIFVSTSEETAFFSNCYVSEDGQLIIQEEAIEVAKISCDSSLDCLTYDVCELKLTLPVGENGKIAGYAVQDVDEEVLTELKGKVVS